MKTKGFLSTPSPQAENETVKREVMSLLTVEAPGKV